MKQLTSSFVFFLLVGVFFLFVTPTVYGYGTYDTGYTVPNGSTYYKIWLQDGTCRLITNTTGTAVFIPTKTMAEWNAFNGSSKPAGLGLTNTCCSTNADCGGGDYWGPVDACNWTMRRGQYHSRGCNTTTGCYDNMSYQDYGDCGTDYAGGEYECSGTMRRRANHSRGCTNGSCYDYINGYSDYEQCYSDYAGENRCNGSMSQRAWRLRGCSGTSPSGACYNNISYWYDETQCNTDYWGTGGSDYRCNGTMRQQAYHSRGCEGAGSCYDRVTGWGDNTQCNGDYWGEYRCNGTMRQRAYRSRGCEGAGSCYDRIAYWADDTQCNGDYWNEYRCNGTMSQRAYYYRGCTGAGTCYNYFGYWADWTQCGSDYWGGAGEVRCNGNTHQEQYHSRGCTGAGSCYHNLSWAGDQVCSLPNGCQTGGGCVNNWCQGVSNTYVTGQRNCGAGYHCNSGYWCQANCWGSSNPATNGDCDGNCRFTNYGSGYCWYLNTGCSSIVVQNTAVYCSPSTGNSCTCAAGSGNCYAGGTSTTGGAFYQTRSYRSGATCTGGCTNYANGVNYVGGWWATCSWKY